MKLPLKSISFTASGGLLLKALFIVAPFSALVHANPPKIVDHHPLSLAPYTAARTRPWIKTIQIDASGAPLFSTSPKPGWLEGAGAIAHGGLGDHEVNLTFDDGPQPQKTVKVLEILKAAGLKTNFFMMGKNAFYYKNIAKKVAADGHVIGSHSVSQPIMRHPTPEFARDQIVCGNYLVGKSTGLDVPFFRFPGGEITHVSHEALKDSRQAAFFWDVDSTDCHAESNPTVIYNQVTRALEAKSRGIILFHDVWAHTAVALPYILEWLYKNDYTIVTYEPANPASVSETYADAPAHCKSIVKNLEAGKQYEYHRFGPDDRE